MLSRDPQPVFRALADPTRRAIISMLASGPRPLNDIVAGFRMSRPAVAKHLAVLEEGGLVVAERVGRVRINRLRPEALGAAAHWLATYDRFWDDKLTALKHEVEK